MRIFSRLNLRDEMQEIYLHRFLNQLAKKFVSIFIPLYLLDVGFSYLAVVGFFLVYFVFSLVGAIPSSLLSSKLGYKKTSLIASPLLLSYYFFLRNISYSFFELGAVAALGGLGATVYWMGMNPEVSKSSHREKDDRETGLFFSIPSLASVAAPALGGIILVLSNFNILFSLTIVLILVSFIPLAFTPEHRDGMELGLKDFLQSFEPVDFGIFMLNGSTWLGQMFVWPLYLAKILTSTGIGGSGTLLALGGAITSIVAGLLSERIGRKNVIMIGGITSALTFVGMSMVTSTFTAFVVSALNGLFMKFLQIPVYGTAMEHSEDSDLIEYHMMRELALNSGRIITMTLFAVFFMLLPLQTAFNFSFGLLVLISLAAIPVGRLMTQSE